MAMLPRKPVRFELFFCFFFIFGIQFCVRGWRDFRLSVLNDPCKISSILDPFSMGFRTPTFGGFFPGCQPIQKPWMSFVALGNFYFLCPTFYIFSPLLSSLSLSYHHYVLSLLMNAFEFLFKHTDICRTKLVFLVSGPSFSCLQNEIAWYRMFEIFRKGAYVIANSSL